MASLYEVSRLEGDEVRGLRNWREDVLKRFWDKRPPIGNMVKMPWHVFNAEDYDLRQQAVNHATARYFVLFLQESGKLDEIFLAYQNQTIEEMQASPEIEAASLLEKTLGPSTSHIDAGFINWLANLGAQDKYPAEIDKNEPDYCNYMRASTY